MKAFRSLYSLHKPKELLSIGQKKFFVQNCITICNIKKYSKNPFFEYLQYLKSDPQNIMLLYQAHGPQFNFVTTSNQIKILSEYFCNLNFIEISKKKENILSLGELYMGAKFSYIYKEVMKTYCEISEKPIQYHQLSPQMPRTRTQLINNSQPDVDFTVIQNPENSSIDAKINLKIQHYSTISVINPLNVSLILPQKDFAKKKWNYFEALKLKFNNNTEIYALLCKQQNLVLNFEISFEINNCLLFSENEIVLQMLFKKINHVYNPHILITTENNTFYSESISDTILTKMTDKIQESGFENSQNFNKMLTEMYEAILGKNINVGTIMEPSLAELNENVLKLFDDNNI